MNLIEKSQALRKIESLRLEEIGIKSNDYLSPLGEPLKQDFGLHRWLAGAREEAYSDWLQSLFAQMSGEDLANVLNLRELSDELEQHIRHKKLGFDRVVREVWVPYGHEGRQGRLDILIRPTDRTVVAIEVKLGSTSKSDLGKNVGYFKSVKERFPCKLKYYVLLVTEGDKVTALPSGVPENFDVRTYPVFCRNLRRLAKKSLGDQTLFASSLILMVAAAIETNLLRMSLQKNSFTPATLSHLQTFLNGPGYE